VICQRDDILNARRCGQVTPAAQVDRIYQEFQAHPAPLEDRIRLAGHPFPAFLPDPTDRLRPACRALLACLVDRQCPVIRCCPELPAFPDVPARRVFQVRHHIPDGPDTQLVHKGLVGRGYPCPLSARESLCARRGPRLPSGPLSRVLQPDPAARCRPEFRGGRRVLRAPEVLRDPGFLSVRSDHGLRLVPALPELPEDRRSRPDQVGPDTLDARVCPAVLLDRDDPRSLEILCTPSSRATLHNNTAVGETRYITN